MAAQGETRDYLQLRGAAGQSFTVQLRSGATVALGESRFDRSDAVGVLLTEERNPGNGSELVAAIALRIPSLTETIKLGLEDETQLYGRGYRFTLLGRPGTYLSVRIPIKSRMGAAVRSANVREVVSVRTRTVQPLEATEGLEPLPLTSRTYVDVVGVVRRGKALAGSTSGLRTAITFATEKCSDVQAVTDNVVISSNEVVSYSFSYAPGSRSQARERRTCWWTQGSNKADVSVYRFSAEVP